MSTSQAVNDVQALAAELETTKAELAAIKASPEFENYERRKAADAQKLARQAIEKKVYSIAGGTPQRPLRRVPCRIVSTGVVVELEHQDAIQKIHNGVATLVE